MNHCGTCSLCCRLLGVEELNKPPGVWCQHCTPGKGCNIHMQPEYPADCRHYACVWRQMKDEGQPIDDQLRPDRCKVVIDAGKDGGEHYLRCDPGYPQAWRQPRVQRLVGAIARSQGSTVYRVAPDGTRHRLQVFVG